MFIGYLVAGMLGATMAAIGIFLPVYVFTIIPAPWFRRNRDNAQLKAFVQGATAAAIGALAGAVVVLAYRAIYDPPTVRWPSRAWLSSGGSRSPSRSWSPRRAWSA